MSDKLLIIGLCGVARSGKDTAARYLSLDHGFTRIGLADGVRSAFRDLDGPTGELTKDLESAGLTQRWALQTLGTDAREALSPPACRYLWVDVLLAKIRYLASFHPSFRTRFVIPDVRFPHEATAIRHCCRRWGGYAEIWKLDRPGAGLAGDAGRHKSETELEQIAADHEIHNTGTPLDLREAVDLAFEEFLRRAGGET